MKRRELLEACERVITSFDPARLTVDAHAEEALRDVRDASDRQFIQQVFYGSFRYRELLKPALTLFLTANAGRVSRNDYTKFLVVSYLAVFRLGELGIDRFRALVTTLDPTAMHTLLAFLFDRDQLHGALRSAWVQVLDQDFVDAELLGKMEKMRCEVDALLAQLHTTAFGRNGATKGGEGAAVVGNKKPVTVPVAPNITQPRPRRAVEPEAIPQRVKARPVPASLQQNSLAELDKQRRERRERTKQQIAGKYDAADAFKFESTARSNLEQVRQEVEAEREAALQFNFKAAPAPDASRMAPPPEVKLTAAAILREDALFKKKQEKEAQMLKAYEAELRDPMEFYRWQAAAQAQDEAARREEVEQRRLEMAQAQFDAIEAAQRARLENREVALQMKAEAAERADERETVEAGLVAKNRAAMAEIKAERESAPREAEAQVREENRRQRDELTEFLAAERARKAEEDAREQAAREDLIRQIRALDRVHREVVTVFDPTSTMALGLLEEMSLAELRERLESHKREQEAWEASRRDDILADKQEKRDDLEDKARSLARRRAAAASATATQRTQRKEAEAAKQREDEARRREGNLKLAEKLQAQREARAKEVARLEAEAAAIAKKRLFLGAAKNLLEESHFNQLGQGAERGARVRQAVMQATVTTDERVRRQEQTMREDFAHNQRVQKKEEDAEKERVVDRAKKDGARRQRDEDELLRRKVGHEQRRYLHAQEVLRNRNPYATAMATGGVRGAVSKPARRATATASGNQIDT